MKKRSCSHEQRKILCIVPRLPWPTRCGASLANSALLQALTKNGWSVKVLVLGAVAQSTDLKKAETALQLNSIECIKFNIFMRSRIVRTCLAIVLQILRKNLPITVIPFGIGGFKRRVLEKIKFSDSDIVLWDGLHTMAALWESIQKCDASFASKIHIYRAHNLEGSLWQHYTAQASALMRPFFRYQWKLMEEFELKNIKHADSVLFINAADTIQMNEKINKKGHLYTLPLAMLEPIQKETKKATQSLSTSDAKNENSFFQIIWLGGIDWWPNKEGLKWFFANVWPKVCSMRPQIRLHVVGRKTEQFTRGKPENTIFHGYVDDPKRLIRACDLMIVPIFSGSGVRVKALEALSLETPCLGTELGLSGIPEEGCWTTNNLCEWVDILTSVHQNQCEEKGKAGGRAFQKRHSIEKTAKTLDEIFTPLLRSRFQGSQDKKILFP